MPRAHHSEAPKKLLVFDGSCWLTLRENSPEPFELQDASRSA